MLSVCHTETIGAYVITESVIGVEYHVHHCMFAKGMSEFMTNIAHLTFIHSLKFDTVCMCNALDTYM